MSKSPSQLHNNTEYGSPTAEGGETPDAISAIQPAPHEFGGNLIFTADGLTPYHRLDEIVRDADGSDSSIIELDGDHYELELSHQESGLAKPTSGDIGVGMAPVREFRINFEAVGDGVSERSGTFLVSPRWPDMQSKGDSPTPANLDITGVNIRINGSNIPIDVYPQLLREAADAFGMNPGYFADSRIHHYSNIFQYERYVRISRDKSKALIGRGGPLEQIFEYIKTEADFRELREDNRDIHGYHHRVKFDSDGANRLISGHKIGKKIKHYHPEHPRDSPDSPLYHPKVGVSLQHNLTSETVRWSDRDNLKTELDELLLNLISWSGLSTRSGDTYVSDDYFTATESIHNIRLIENPLPEIKRKQETTVVDGLTANPDLQESDREVLDLLTDGGPRHMDELAGEADCSKRTIYRVLDRLSEIFSNETGMVGFASDYIRRTVRTTIDEAKDALTSGEQSGGDVSPFRKWANAHGVEVDTEDGRLVLRFGRVPDSEDMRQILNEGWRAWRDSGNKPARYRVGKAVWESGGRPTYRVPIIGR